MDSLASKLLVATKPLGKTREARAYVLPIKGTILGFLKQTNRQTYKRILNIHISDPEISARKRFGPKHFIKFSY